MTTIFSRETPSQENIQIFAASFAQQHFWFLHQLEPEIATYNIPVAIRLRRLPHVEMLERSLNVIVQRHEVLRTTFGMMEGQLIQVIAPIQTVPLAMVDLRSLPEMEREVKALRLATEEAQKPFDLNQGPLVRTTLLQ